MDDGKLRALLTAVECGSFSKAAAQLGYTQSAMTHLVNKLEAEVGCTLLKRDSQGIRLTDAGKQLLPYIQNVICACDTLLQEAAEQNDPRTRTLRIGCFASIARARLPELLRAFRELHPEIKMDVLVRGDELPAALASGEIQLALVDEARAQGFDFLPLADTPLVAVVPPDFPWEGETIPLERLLREPFLSSPDQYIEPFLPPDTPRLEVTASDGVSVLSSFSLVGYEGQVRVLQLEKPIALRLGAAVKSVNTIGTSARMFLTFLREYYGKDDTQ